VECEKFESLLIDELYGELDEVTSAAVKRHAAGCARCGALLSGFRATRKVAALPVEEPSGDLEDRILSAVREQQKVLPLRARMSTMLSRAGAWAMQPQTAMAAVLLLVIGTSFVLVQSRKSMAPAADTRAAEGAPVMAAASGAAASAYALDGKEAAFAHGVDQNEQPGRARASATMMPQNTAPDLLESEKDRDDKSVASRRPLEKAKEELSMNSANAATVAGVGDLRGGYGGEPRTSGAGGGGAAPSVIAQAQAGPIGGTVDAALSAARAEKAKDGCTAAVIQHFEQVRQSAGNTTAGHDATLEVGRCYRSAGNSELARSRFSSLLQAQNYATQAQSELDQMTPVAAHKAMQRETPRPVATTTAAAPVAPPTQKAADSAGY
jgi:hypothetical protein